MMRVVKNCNLLPR